MVLPSSLKDLFLYAVMAALWLIVFGVAQALQSSSSSSASSQHLPCAQALMAALWLVVLGHIFAIHMACKRETARCYCPPFSHAVRAAL